MNVIIYGASQLGAEIARHLVLQNIDVTVIDKSEKALQKIQNLQEINRVIGNIFDVEFLKGLNFTESTYIIAALHSDEQNILACKITDSFFNVKTKIALLRSQIFWQGSIFEMFLRENFGIDIMIQPESEIAGKISEIVQITGALDVLRLPNFVAVRTLCLPNTEIINTSLTHLPEISDVKLFVLSVTRDERIFFPESSDSLFPGDEVFFIVPEDDLHEAMRLFGYPQESAQKLLIGGSERIENPLVRELLLKNPSLSITIVEDSLKQAEELAQKFPDCTVVNEDFQNANLLQDIGTRYFDTAIVCSDHERRNILASLLLKQSNISRILTLCASENYNSLFSAEDRCSLINPGNIVLESVMRNLGKNKNFSVISGQNHFFYIIDVRVSDQFDVVENNILSIARDDFVVPLFQVRDENINIIQSDTALQSDDRVIILSSEKYIKFVEKFFFGYSFVS